MAMMMVAKVLEEEDANRALDEEMCRTRRDGNLEQNKNQVLVNCPGATNLRAKGGLGPGGGGARNLRSIKREFWTFR